MRTSLRDNLKEMWKHKEFLKYNTLAKLKIRHKGTILGYLWWLLDPLLFMLIYLFIVQIIFKRGGPDYPVFVFLALLPWRWFSSTLNEAANSIRGKAGLIKQIYFPKINLVISVILSNFINFCFGLIIMLIILLVFKIKFTIFFLFFPLIVLIQILLITGLSLIIAHFNVFFKDVSNTLRYILQMWFFLSPAIYSADLIPKKFLFIYSLNPFYTIFNSYRDSIMYSRFPDIFGLGIILIFSLILIVIGIKLIARHQGNYAKIL